MTTADEGPRERERQAGSQREEDAAASFSLISILTGVSTTAATEFLQEILFPGEPVLPHSKKREESSCSFVSRMTCESEGHSRGALVRGISGTGARSLTLSRRHTQRLICRAKEEGEKGGCFLRRLLLPPPALVLVHHLSCQSLPVPHQPCSAVRCE